MFVQVANRVKEVVKNSRCEYQTIIGHKTAAIHPASVLFQRKPYPDAIVYTISKLEKKGRGIVSLTEQELVYTTKEYFRGVTAIEATWLPELIPEWFSSKE